MLRRASVVEEVSLVEYWYLLWASDGLFLACVNGYQNVCFKSDMIMVELLQQGRSTTSGLVLSKLISFCRRIGETGQQPVRVLDDCSRLMPDSEC
ncbi:hypothetical protein GOBAR_AA33283 [Gossypium barbadense]|uniref:Uncharacterized protein n=1 Tax=Gossypium barbadense TaxID=3634 RepID=A0A2P5W8J6_GOSBA|nr:hypothetical protein GOBAR_AA33283 [Gossypium barbadense]